MFIILFIERYENPLPVEVKYSALKTPEITRSLRGFIAHYHPLDAWIINLTLAAKMKVEGTLVHFIPFFKLQDYLQDLHDEPQNLFKVSETEIPYRLLHDSSRSQTRKSGLYTRKW